MRTPSIVTPRLAATALALAALLPLPAAARDFVQDQAGMFSASTVAQLNQRISNFNAQTGKEIVVVTVPSLDGATLQSAASSTFASQNVNGVLIFIAKSDRRDIIVPDRSGVQAGWFTPDVLRGIRESMEAQFRSENYDAGISAAVDGVLNVYRAHVGSLRGNANSSYSGAPATATNGSGGFHLSMFWWIIIAIVGFMLLRSIFRAMSGPRYYGGAPGTPGAGATGPMPGYGAGYGGYGGGGSFWSGLLGGLGGAWLGNEMFGNRGGGFASPADASQAAPDAGGGWGGGDGGGWQSDAGQADTSAGSAGDWSGGGFGGDSGGGLGGGDFGGGGGDSGGGW